MSKNHIKKAASVMLAAAIVFSAAACNKTETVDVQTAIKVNAQHPVVDSIQQTASFTGKVMPDDSVSVYGKSSGTVLKTYVGIGDTVAEGDLLFELDPKDYLISLEQSKLVYEKSLNDVDTAEKGSGDALTELGYQTRIDNAQNAYVAQRDILDAKTGGDFDMSDFKRYRKDLKAAEEAYDDAVAANADSNELKAKWQTYTDALRKYNDTLDDYDDYQSLVTAFESAYTNYESIVKEYEIYKSTKKGENTQTFDISRQQAKLAYDSMLQTMDNLKVYAPIDGIIEAKNVSANDTYAPAMAGYVVSNKDVMVVNFAVSGDVARTMTVGDAVTVENGGSSFKAEVTEIGTIVNAASGLFPVKARFIEKADMLSGVTVKLTAITAKSKNSLLIPVDSIYYDDGVTYVYTVSAENILAKTPVTIGIISGDTAEVTSGLDASSLVVTTWNPNLNDGVAVEASEEV